MRLKGKIIFFILPMLFIFISAGLLALPEYLSEANQSAVNETYHNESGSEDGILDDLLSPPSLDNETAVSSPQPAREEEISAPIEEPPAAEQPVPMEEAVPVEPSAPTEQTVPPAPIEQPEPMAEPAAEEVSEPLLPVNETAVISEPEQPAAEQQREFSEPSARPGEKYVTSNMSMRPDAESVFNDAFNNGIDPVVAEQAGLFELELNGKDIASGSVFDMNLKNKTAEKIKIIINTGTILIPSDLGYQRMVSCEKSEYDFSGGQAATLSFNGFCLDPLEYPPPKKKEPYIAWLSLPSFGLTSGAFWNMPVSDAKKVPDIVLEIGKDSYKIPKDYTGYIYENPFNVEFFTIPYIQQLAKKCQAENICPKTGLLPETELLTFAQWYVWNITDNFSAEDGKEKIAKQAKETAGKMTAEQVEQLSDNIWEAVELIKRQIRANLKEGNIAEDVLAATPGLQNLKALIFSDHILTEEESRHLSGILSGISGEGGDVAVLRGVALCITQKVVSDAAGLQFLLADLEKLAKEKYSSKIGGIKPKNITVCKGRIKNMIKDMKNKRPNFSNSTDKLTGNDYVVIINQNGAFLTRSGYVETPTGIWSSVDKETSEAIFQWNKKYEELLGKIHKSESRAPENILSNEELKFVKTYGRFIMLFSKLAGTRLAAE